MQIEANNVRDRQVPVPVQGWAVTESRGRPLARSQRGFTLMELMVAVAIVGILAAVAYPSYGSYIRKSKRATAQAALMDISAKEQAYLLDRRAYTGVLSDLGFAAPQEIRNDYTFTVVPDNTASPLAFVATATPINGQAAQGERTLTVDQRGLRTPAGTHGYWTD
ncbi:MAG: type IV pilin protein [Burkholderiales bacterium]|nr:type IV pilin protein [Burkholderiales bacterium]